METEITIDKNKISLTSGQVIAILLFVITTTAGAFNYMNVYNKKIDKIESKLEKFEESVNSKFDIVNITQKNQYHSNKNDRKRDSTDNANNFKNVINEVKDMKSVLFRYNVGNSQTASN